MPCTLSVASNRIAACGMGSSCSRPKPVKLGLDLTDTQSSCEVWRGLGVAWRIRNGFAALGTRFDGAKTSVSGADRTKKKRMRDWILIWRKAIEMGGGKMEEREREIKKKSCPVIQYSVISLPFRDRDECKISSKLRLFETKSLEDLWKVYLWDSTTNWGKLLHINNVMLL